MKILAVLALCICSIQAQEFVESVRQNYHQEINGLLNDQIQKELTASYIYHAYASFFQRSDVNLPGIQKFFAEAAKEEREHAQSLIDYVNKRGGHAQFSDIDLKGACETVLANRDAKAVPDPDSTRMCICSFVSTKDFIPSCSAREEWKSGLMAFEDALATERYVNALLLSIHSKADDHKDAHLTDILEEEFLDEQVNSINQLARYVTRLRSFSDSNYKLGEYIFDQNLS